MTATASSTFVDGLTFGEGPRWHDGRLWYSDFFTTAVWSVADDGAGPRREVEVGDRPSGLGWLPDGRLLVVSMVRRSVLRRERDGTLVQHADLSPWAVGLANDMLVCGDGRAYVGHFGFDLEAFFEGTAAPATATLLVVDADGTARVAAHDLRFPNGMDTLGRTLVVAETFGARLSAFEVDDGRLSGRRTWADLEGCAPDGICGDDEGAVWVANAAAPECLRVAEGGRVLERVTTSQPCFACVLGGEDRTTLFCLTAPTSRVSRRSATRDGRIEVARVTVPGPGTA